jgi:hypothetical protein
LDIQQVLASPPNKENWLFCSIFNLLWEEYLPKKAPMSAMKQPMQWIHCVIYTSCVVGRGGGEIPLLLKNSRT